MLSDLVTHAVLVALIDIHRTHGSWPSFVIALVIEILEVLDAASDAALTAQNAYAAGSITKAARDAAVSAYDNLTAAFSTQQAVPVVKTLNSDGVAVALADQNSGTQYTAPNYALSPPSGLEAEAITKLSNTGLGPQFGTLSRTVGLPTVNGTQVATETATNAPLVVVTPNATPAGLPAGAIPAADTNKTDQYRLKLVANPSANYQTTVTFNVMPTISESRQANYASFTPIQHPGEILKYQGTSSRTWSVTVQLVSRTVDEATQNQANLNIIRSWVMPFYGVGTANNQFTAAYLGAPPPIITLTAYGDYAIGPVKCIMENYSFDWPNTVDYIQTVDGQPFPVLATISMHFKESFSPAEYSGFDLSTYGLGRMANAFQVRQNNYTTTTVTTSPPESSVKNTSQPQVVSAVQAQKQAAPSTAQTGGFPPNAATKQSAIHGLTTGTVPAPRGRGGR